LNETNLIENLAKRVATLESVARDRQQALAQVEPADWGTLPGWWREGLVLTRYRRSANNGAS
jgi:hypothetical protein